MAENYSHPSLDVPSIVFTDSDEVYDTELPVRRQPNDHVTPEVRDMIQYLVATCILNHRIASQIAVYESSASPVLTPYTPVEAPKRARRKSFLGNLHESKPGSPSAVPGSQHHHSHFSHEKLPKDFALELRKKLRRTLYSDGQVGHHKREPAIRNPVTKKIYVEFSKCLTESYNETLNRSRRPEDLIVAFCTAAHSVISTQDDSHTLEAYLKPFVQYLIDMLSRKGYYFTHKSLVRQLESYLSTIKKGNTLQPAVTYASANLDFKQNLEVARVHRTSKLVPDPEISFNLENMPLIQYMARLFNVSDGYMQYMIDDLTYISTEANAFADLIKCRNSLTLHDLHPTYLRGDFKDPEAYEKWKLEELQNLDHDIESLRVSIPIYKDKKEEPVEFYEAHDCVYVPKYPMKYYQTLISMCIEHDAASCNPGSFEFSSEATSLLGKIMMHWRLTPVSESMILLQEACNYCTLAGISFGSLVNQVFPYAMEGLKTAKHKGNNDDRSLNLQEWTNYEKSVAYLTMSNTLELCVSEIVGQLDLSANDLQPEIEKIMTFIDTYVVPFSIFDEFPRLKITDNHLMAVKEQVSYITEIRFQRESLRFPVHIANTTGISFDNLLQLIYEVKSTTSRIHSCYQCIELFGFIDLAGLATQFYLISFIRYLKTVVLSDPKLKNPAAYDPESYSYDDFDQILDGLSDIVYIFERSMDQKATANHDDAGISVFVKMRRMLAPLLLRKIEISADVLLEWVGRIVKSDSFEPLPDSQISSSVVDLFSSFRSLTKVVTSLKWNSPAMTAKFCTVAMKVSISTNRVSS